MDAIGGKIADGYLENGVLGLTVLVLLFACIFLYRSKETQRSDDAKAMTALRDQAEAKIAELQEKRITEQARVIEAMNKSASVNEIVGSRLDSLADALRGRRD